MKRNPKRTLLAWLLTAAMLVSLLPSAAFAASGEAGEEETSNQESTVVTFAGGDGTEENPYQVETAEQLNAVRNNLSAHYIQISDIDMSGVEWVTIGNYDEPFSGSYDGSGYQISNLSSYDDSVVQYTTNSSFYCGLFAYNTGTLENITLEECFISLDTSNYSSKAYSYNYIGAVAGLNTGNVIDCSASGEMIVNDGTGVYYVCIGGIIGSGSCEECVNSMNVSFECNLNCSQSVYCGGISGYTSTITNCVNYGEISVVGSDFLRVGGISGSGSVDNCVNYANVSATLVGLKHFGGDGANCCVGGILGLIRSKVTDSANFGDILAIVNISYYNVTGLSGGIIGGLSTYCSGQVSNCYNLSNAITINMLGESYNYGIPGRISGGSNVSISDCYSLDTTTVNGEIPDESETGTTTIHGASMTEDEITEAIASILTGDEVDSYIPSTNGWAFRNYSLDTVSEDVWFRVLSNNAIGKIIYTLRKNNSSSGLCYGVAVSSALSYIGLPCVSEWKDGATTASEVDATSKDNYSATYGLSLTEYIQAVFSYQYSSNAASEASANKNQYSAIINEARSFEETGNNPIAIVINGTDADGNKHGHCLIPYKVVEQDNAINVYVYDCNYYAGYDEAHSENNRYITFICDDTGAIASWNYDQYTWTSSNCADLTYYTNLSIINDAILNYDTLDSSVKTLFFSNSCEFTVGTEAGDTVNCVNGYITGEENTGILPVWESNFLPDNSVDGDEDILLYLDDVKSLSVQNNNTENDEIVSSIVDEHSIVTVSSDGQSNMLFGISDEQFDVSVTPSSSSTATISYTTNDGNTIFEIEGEVSETASVSITCESEEVAVSGYEFGTITVITDGTTEATDFSSDETTDGFIISIDKDGCIELTPLTGDTDTGSAGGDSTHTHTWDEGTVTLAATRVSEGEKTYTCTVCGETQTETVAKLTGSAAEFLFSDVTNEESWYYDAVYWAYDLKITEGYSDGTFLPNKNCSRAEFATFLYALANAYGLENAGETESRSFTDVKSGSWYYTYVMWAAENGLVSGYSDGTFQPNREITRAEAVTMLYGFYKTFVNGGVDPELEEEAETTFSDLSEGSWYYTYMLWAIQNGVVSGYPDGTCRPNTNCTRSVMVVLLYATANHLL